ncbi:uncharacterized protein P884DRAFT_270671 [Thermothelomyces heterothallicus CBS 202.75]|uniref:uncharacterized protein n=1 Tax=Thermothelomyces heterothallicus CBS 202.75 TaxID=1149848 RepID=UPI003743ABF5
MVKFPDQYAPPEVSTYTGSSNYAEWKFTLFLHLDWHDLRPFVVDTVAAPAPDATDKERLAYKRKKIMSYAILRDSVRDWLEKICTYYEFHWSGDGPKPGCHCMALYDHTYNANSLWQKVHELTRFPDSDDEY